MIPPSWAPQSLSFVVRDRNLCALALGLAGEYETLCLFRRGEREISGHRYRANHYFRFARTAYARFARIRELKARGETGIENSLPLL